MNSSTLLKGGLVGCGFFAQNHLNGWQTLKNANIVAVCDLDLHKSSQAVEVFADVARAYDSMEQMLTSESLDFVDIVTTMDTHKELIELAARYKVPAIVQKPFAPTMADANHMVEQCNQAGIALMVHENFRWQTPLRQVRQVISSGKIGSPFFSRISFRHGNPVGYENQPYLYEQDEYIVNDVGIHLFDLARYYMGDVTTIYAQNQRVNTRFKGEDVSTILLRHSSDASTIVDLSVSSKFSDDPFPQTLVQIEATNGTVTLHQNFTMTVVTDDGTEHHDVGPVIYPWAEQPWAIVQESVVNIQKHWCDCLLQGSLPETSGADNLRSLELTFLAYESARTGRVIPVP